MSRPRLTAVVTAAAVIVAGGAGAAAAAESKTRTSLSIREARSAIFPGGTDHVGGQLRATGVGPLAGATVALEARPAGSDTFSQVATATTGENGGVHFIVQPGGTTRYELVFAGDDNDRPSHSGIVTVVVRHRIPTALGIRADQTSIAPGDSDTVRGRLHLAHRRRGLPGRTVYLTQRSVGSDGWSVVASATTGEHGGVAFPVTPSTSTRYALVFRHTRRLARARSRVVTVFVGQPTALSIQVGSRSVDPGGSDSVSGALTSAGQPLAGQTVLLRARPVSADTASTIGSATTGPDGRVTFTVTPAEKTRYRLVFRRTADFAPARSVAVTVAVRQPTSLSIRATHDTVAAGDPDGISGVLLTRSRPLRRRVVTLLERPAGTTDWTTVGSHRTGDRGFVAFRVHPTVTEDFQLVFGPTDNFQACHSGVVTVSVV